MGDMEAVSSFNAELQGLYDVKPPISKGKMTSVTRAALKGVKLYKHVVQSVEKFILKCKTEYKIPGLYVIDSIIRQSRHQFGAEKDVFAPRFARNIQTTFMHLYKCPEEDKAKIIRVLNLWQKNKIFTPELIQPLFDLADPNNPIWERLESQQQDPKSLSGGGGGPGPSSNVLSAGGGLSSVLSSLNIPSSVPFKKEILDFDYGDEDDGDGQPKQQQNNQHNTGGDFNQQQQQNQHVGFDALGSILANPEILRQLATLQEQIAAATSHQGGSGGGYPTPEQERQRKLAELNKQEAAFDQRLAQTVARLPFAVDCEMVDDGKSPRKDNRSSSVDQNSNQLQSQNQLLPPPFFHQISEQTQHQQQQHQQQQDQHTAQQQHQALMTILGQQHDGQNPFGIQFPVPGGQHFSQQHQELSQNMGMFNSQISNSDGLNQSFSAFNQQSQIQPPVEIDLTDDSKDRDRRDRRRKRSRERRSRSASRNRMKRSRSRSRGRKRINRSRSKDRKDTKERERERARKGMPPLKKEHMSVCSTTLWVGHLSKLVSQEELSDTFGSFGDIISIDLIPPRGCAFIVMNRRQDALRALERLKNTKLQGKTITLAWAPGKGMKGRDWKDYWEVETGVSYIPWSKLRSETNLEEFEDGGCVDEDTLPEFLKNKPKAADRDKTSSIPFPESAENSQDASTPNVSTPSGISMTNNPPQLPLVGVQLLGSMSDSLAGISNDKDSRNDLQGMGANPSMGGMVNPPFGIPPPMMQMTMPVGMIPPPMLGPGMGGFGLPGMPMMGMMAGGLGGPSLGGPGLLGDMPTGQGLPSLSQLNAIQQQLNQSRMNLDGKASNISESLSKGRSRDEDDRRRHGQSDRKRRSRFDDPDDKNSVTMEDINNINSSPQQQQDPAKDDRPVFERLKSLAEGYGFGGPGANDKSPSLLGNPHGGIGPRGPVDRMPGPHGFPQPLLSNGQVPFGQRGPPPFMGDRARAPPGPQGPGIGGPRAPWFDTTNPFLNPNPFAGNPFIQANMTENPFDIGAPPRNDEGNLPGVGGPTPLFGTGGPSDRIGFAGRGRGGWGRDGPPGGAPGGRGRCLLGPSGRGGWREEQGGGGGWQEQDDRENSRDRDRGDSRERGDRGFRGGGRGRGRDSWNNRDGRDRDESERGRRDDRDRSGESRDRDRGDRSDRDGRRGGDRDRRDRSRDDNNSSRGGGERRRRSVSEDQRDIRASERQSQDRPQRRPSEDEWNESKPISIPPQPQQETPWIPVEENWEDETPPLFVQRPVGPPAPQVYMDENWEEEEVVPGRSAPKVNENWEDEEVESWEEKEEAPPKSELYTSAQSNNTETNWNNADANVEKSEPPTMAQENDSVHPDNNRAIITDDFKSDSHDNQTSSSNQWEHNPTAEVEEYLEPRHENVNEAMDNEEHQLDVSEFIQQQPRRDSYENIQERQDKEEENSEPFHQHINEALDDEDRQLDEPELIQQLPRREDSREHIQDRQDEFIQERQEEFIQHEFIQERQDEFGQKRQDEFSQEPEEDLIQEGQVEFNQEPEEDMIQEGEGDFNQPPPEVDLIQEGEGEFNVKHDVVDFIQEGEGEFNQEPEEDLIQERQEPCQFSEQYSPSEIIDKAIMS